MVERSSKTLRSNNARSEKQVHDYRREELGQILENQFLKFGVQIKILKHTMIYHFVQLCLYLKQSICELQDYLKEMTNIQLFQLFF